MKAIPFKPKEIEIPADEPFKNDKLNRNESADVLTQFVTRLDEPFVIAIDSPWGTGKTTFLRMWLQHMKNQGINCLHFNAWQNDFSDSPFVSLIGELGAGIETLHMEQGQAQKAKELLEKAKAAGATLVKTTLPTAIKMLTAGVIDLSELADLAGEVAKKQIEKYESDKTTIAHFRRELEKLVKSISGANEDSQTKPLLFVIDELDRCRPPFAIELLEKIKHLFSVDGLVFVLAIDKRQLNESVKALYGSGIDADAYLKRFIDLEYHLPQPDMRDFIVAQFNRFGLHNILAKRANAGDEYRELCESMTECFTLFAFSLRVQEQIFTHLSVSLRTTPRTEYLCGSFLVFLLCLRTASRDLYWRYVQGRTTHEEVLGFVKKCPGAHQFVNSRPGCLMEAYLILAIKDETVRQHAVEQIERLSKANAGEQDTIDHAKEVMSCFSWMHTIRAHGMIDFIVRRIELAQRFASDNL